MLISEHVRIKWTIDNKKILLSCGYSFTNIGDHVHVSVEDIPNKKRFNGFIEVKCDVCNEHYKEKYQNYDPDKFDLCKNCKPKKANGTKRFYFKCIADGNIKIKLAVRAKDEKEAKNKLNKQYNILKILDIKEEGIAS